MTAPRMLATALAAAGAAAVVVGQIRRRTRDHSRGTDRADRWLAVTIDKTVSEVMTSDQVPGRLAEVGPQVEVETREAPGGKGTELRARLRTPAPTGPAALAARVSGDDPRQQLRAALRETKQLIEVGELLRVDPVPHGHRPATPQGKLVDLLARRAPKEGLL